MKLRFTYKLCMALCCALLSLNVSGQDIKITFEKIDYLLHEDGTATLRGWSYEKPFEETEKTGEIIIPDSVSHEEKSYQVTEIGMNALRNSKSITSVILPQGITKINSNAFEGCSSITSFIIPNNVTFIGDEAFMNCASLAEITMPNSVEYLGYTVFKRTAWYNNSPDGLIYINHILYKYKGTMPKETIIEVKKGTTYIANSALSGQNGLVSVNLPASLKKLGNAAFFNCRNLEEITLPKNLEYIGKKVFDDTKITKLIIPAKVSYMEDCLNGSTMREIHYLGPVPPKVVDYEPTLASIWGLTHYVPFRSFLEYFKAGVIPQYSIGDLFHVKTLEGEDIFSIQAEVYNPEENGGKVLINGMEQKIVGALLGAKNITIKAIANEGYEIDMLSIGGNEIHPVGMTSFVQKIPSVYQFVGMRVGFRKKNNIASVFGQTEEGIRVYASEGKVKIENANESVPVSILSLEGRMVYQGMADGIREVSLPAGMYVVTVGVQTYKVVVK